MGRGLADVGEHRWLARLLRRLARGPRDARVLVGPGDDAAVLRAPRVPIVVTTDALVEGVHFRQGWLGGRALGTRAFGVNASDLAAMGARPLAAVLALACPPPTSSRLLDEIVAGVAAAARHSGGTLVGGNISAASELSVTITLLGSAPGPVVRRSGARPGDVLVLTGHLGAMATAVRSRLAGGKLRLPRVPDRVAIGVALAPIVHAMIDVSDGLAQDLGHLCRASGVGAVVTLEALPVARACVRALGREAPVFAATAGEDHELLVALPPRALPRAARLAARYGCPLTPIGRCVKGGTTVRFLDPAGRPVSLARTGHDHFRRQVRYGRY